MAEGKGGKTVAGAEGPGGGVRPERGTRAPGCEYQKARPGGRPRNTGTGPVKKKPEKGAEGSGGTGTGPEAILAEPDGHNPRPGRKRRRKKGLGEDEPSEQRRGPGSLVAGSGGADAEEGQLAGEQHRGPGSLVAGSGGADAEEGRLASLLKKQEEEMQEYPDLKSANNADMIEELEVRVHAAHCTKKGGGLKARTFANGRILNLCRYLMLGVAVSHATVVDGYGTQSALSPEADPSFDIQALMAGSEGKGVLQVQGKDPETREQVWHAIPGSEPFEVDATRVGVKTVLAYQERDLRVLGKKARKRRTINHLRYEGSREAEGEAGVPVGHYEDHKPAHPGCRFCEEAKMQKSGAFRVGSAEAGAPVADKPLKVVALDLMGPVDPPDIHGNRMFLASVDRFSKYPRGLPLPDKEPETTWKAFSTLYPGTRHEEHTSFPAVVSIDNGKEWKGAFEEGLRRSGGAPRKGLPRRSETNAEAENLMKSVQRGGTACMLTASAPLPFWSYAARMWCYNVAHKPEVEGDEASAPYHRLWKKEFGGVLYPFGCGCSYYDDKRTVGEKYTQRARKGIILGYAQLGAVQVLDAEKFRESEEIKITVTRDFQAHRDEFPWRGMPQRSTDAEVVAALEKTFVGDNHRYLEFQIDQKGTMRCLKCRKVKCRKCPSNAGIAFGGRCTRQGSRGQSAAEAGAEAMMWRSSTVKSLRLGPPRWRGLRCQCLRRRLRRQHRPSWKRRTSSRPRWGSRRW